MDSIDDAQERAEQHIARSIKAATGKFNGISAMFCDECEAAIPEKRRLLLPGVRLCVD